MTWFMTALRSLAKPVRTRLSRNSMTGSSRETPVERVRIAFFGLAMVKPFLLKEELAGIVPIITRYDKGVS